MLSRKKYDASYSAWDRVHLMNFEIGRRWRVESFGNGHVTYEVVPNEGEERQLGGFEPFGFCLKDTARQTILAVDRLVDFLNDLGLMRQICEVNSGLNGPLFGTRRVDQMAPMDHVLFQLVRVDVWVEGGSRVEVPITSEEIGLDEALREAPVAIGYRLTYENIDRKTFLGEF